MVIFIPPVSQVGPEPTVPLPSCLLNHPTAVINYRWQPHNDPDDPGARLHWPVPLHDVLFGYSWLSSNLGLADNDDRGPRSAYVYGSYLGASLAAGLALTESHLPDPSRPMTVRGLIAHNGIYNWTMFLPDHPIHKPRPSPKARRPGGLLLPIPDLDEPPENMAGETNESDMFTLLQRQTPSLFSSPADLFDPFASACLFFHTPNLHVPGDFTTPLSASSSSFSSEWTRAIDLLSSSSRCGGNPEEIRGRDGHGGRDGDGDDESAQTLLARAAHLAKQLRPPRKGYMVFPPRGSTLRLPDTLLLYDDNRPAAAAAGDHDSVTRRPKKKKASLRRSDRNSFRVQAAELASLMRRSLGMAGLKQRLIDDEFGDREARAREAERRVQLREVGKDTDVEWGRSGLDEDGEELVAAWLRERIDEEKM